MSFLPHPPRYPGLNLPKNTCDYLKRKVRMGKFTKPYSVKCSDNSARRNISESGIPSDKWHNHKQFDVLRLSEEIRIIRLHIVCYFAASFTLPFAISFIIIIRITGVAVTAGTKLQGRSWRSVVRNYNAREEQGCILLGASQRCKQGNG